MQNRCSPSVSEMAFMAFLSVGGYVSYPHPAGPGDLQLGQREAVARGSTMGAIPRRRGAALCSSPPSGPAQGGRDRREHECTVADRALGDVVLHRLPPR